jgi:pimeloyl-ACP methyl ester carboxylesterase
MMPFVKTEKNGAVLFFDDRGRWTELRQNGLLAELTHFLQMDQKHASVMTVDLRGWGDTQAADLPYEIAAWGHSSRWISYVSAAVGDHILAMRIKDGLAALKALRTIQAVDSAKIVVAGDGMGGVVAQHVAVLDGKVAGCVAINSLATFESLAVSEKYAWSHDAFLPNVLEYYDLPDLAAWLNKPVMLLNPLDAEKKGLALEAMVKIYSAAKERNPRLQIVQTERIVSKLKPWVESLIY